MKRALEERLNELPVSPGVYLFTSDNEEILYVGKASVLRNRVRQYFQSSRGFDNKTLALVRDIEDIDWIETESEVDALFLENELIKRYMPRYNILLRDDRSQLFVRIDIKSEWPVVSFTRNPLDDEAEYIGPFYNGYALRRALRYLRKVFPYLTNEKSKVRSRLDEDIGLAPKKTDGPESYRADLKKLIEYVKGNRTAIIKSIERDMKLSARSHRYEEAARYRNQLIYLEELRRRAVFSDRDFMDTSKDYALRDLTELFGLDGSPVRIEGFDISHISGTDVVASMVVFLNGVPAKAEYRRFKIKLDRNDDTANMREVISRRFSGRNIKSWGKPDMVVIDGGAGQVSSAIESLGGFLGKMPLIGLAEGTNSIIVDTDYPDVLVDKNKVNELGGRVSKNGHFCSVSLPNDTHLIRLLQRIRDEAHRFAVSYHALLRSERSVDSMIERIPGVGPKTRTKLLRHFSSIKSIQGATYDELSVIVGPRLARQIKEYLSYNK